MSQELCHQQEALWELLTTELIYIRKLKIMTDVSPSQSQPWPHPQPYTHLPYIFSDPPRPEEQGCWEKEGQDTKRFP